VSDATVEVAEVRPERTESFRAANEREALSTLWRFPVVWHEQRHELAAFDGEAIVGVVGLHIAASLARIESVVVVATRRRTGIGRSLLSRAEAVANYYNCHKVTLEVPTEGDAQRFFEACGYKTEAVLTQHTFKRDVAVMRKFLL
jgi:N-acetylglutamate synthase-like GNAT family acetyltransferase